MKRDNFSSVNDVINSVFWSKLNDFKVEDSSHIFKSSKLEDMIYNDLREAVDDGLDEIEAQGAEKLDSFPSLIQDTFQSLYSINPKRTDEDTLATNARLFNKEIMEHVLSSDEYPAFKAICEGRDLPAYEAVKEFASQIFKKLDELLDAANNAKTGENKKLLDLIKKLEAQRDNSATQVSSMLEQSNNGSMSDEAERKLLKAANNAKNKQQQIESLTGMVIENIRKMQDVFNDAVNIAIKAAKEKAEQAEVVLTSWGQEGANPETVKHNAELLKRVQDNDKIKSIAKYLGKYREILNNARKNSYAFGRGAKYDIVLGNDFTRAVSSEYAYLATPETVPLFIQKVQKKALKQYRKRERIIKGYGDVVICLDESYSMSGEPIAWGKALALTLMEAAHKNGRDCVIIRFSGPGEVHPHYFLRGKFTTDDIFTFADSFMGGGTEFTGPLTKAAEIIENESFRNADVLFLTDGECDVDQEYADSFKEKRIALNFTANAIILDKDVPGSASSLDKLCDRVYRLSEMTADEVAEGLIKKVA